MIPVLPKSWCDDVDQLRGNKNKLAQWSGQVDDPAVRVKLDELVQDHESCLHAHAHALAVAADVPQLRRTRRVVQAAADRHAQRRPSKWRWLRRRAWESERQRRYGLLVCALREEREAYAGIPDAVHTALSYRVRLLRKEVDAMEVAVTPKPVEVVQRDPVTLAKEIQDLMRARAAAKATAPARSP